MGTHSWGSDSPSGVTLGENTGFVFYFERGGREIETWRSASDDSVCSIFVGNLEKRGTFLRGHIIIAAKIISQGALLIESISRRFLGCRRKWSQAKVGSKIETRK